MERLNEKPIELGQLFAVWKIMHESRAFIKPDMKRVLESIICAMLTKLIGRCSGKQSAMS
mgnify:CR=1 FL=1